MKSKIPKIICGVFATISIAVLAFLALPSLWFWVCWEIIAAALVAVGCGGEWYLFQNAAKEGHESLRRRRELQFIAVVAIGVTLEFIALIHAIPEALRREREIRQLESNNLVLRSNVVTLELMLQDRKISPAKREKLIECLRKAPKGPILIAWDIASGPKYIQESRNYAVEIAEMMRDAGGFPRSQANINLASTAAPGVLLLVRDASHPPDQAIAIQQCFKENGVVPADIQSYGPPDAATLETNMETNIVIIWVSQKP